ncbi:MAG: glycosyltransferase [Cyanophyceae cyanobacterium]
MRIVAQPAFKERYKNPYTWLLHTHLESLGGNVDEFSPVKLLERNYDIWHRHWPERVLNETNPAVAIAKVLSLMLLTKFARGRGTKVVWTIHNLAAHEQLYPRLEDWFWKNFLGQLDGYISLSKTAMITAQQYFPELKKLPGCVIPHGHYRGEYPDEVSPHEARAKLGLSPSAKVILAFGQIRPYKNFPKLITAFRQLADPEAVLCIAGRPRSAAIAEEIKAAAALDPQVQLHLDYIFEDNVQTYFRASDLVVLPYREILNSGSALLALSFDRPILVPLKGSLSELQEEVGVEWVHTYEGEIARAHIEKALEWALNTQRPEKAPLMAYEWQIISQQTLSAYEHIVAISAGKM